MAAPMFPEVTLRPEGGKTFTIRAENSSDTNIYIQQATLNGKPYTKNYLTHTDIMAGGTLVLKMGPEPNKEWGCRPEDCPPNVMNPQ